MKVVYIAHPLGNGDDRDRNLLNAARWCAYFAARHAIAPLAPWIVLASVWDESRRALGLTIDVATVTRCDELWMCGGRVSPGMKLEAEHARQHGIPVRDFTPIGYAAPSECVAVDELLRMTRIERDALQVQWAPEAET